MKRLVSAGILFLSLAMANLSEAVPRDRFAGAWRLAWLEEPDAKGEIHRIDCTGMLVFTRDGHMSVQVMQTKPQAPSQAAAVQYAQGGYEASFGRYQLDERARTLTFHVEGALVRTLVGKDLVRSFELTGNQLIVRSADPAERWRVGWERE
jgi:hypothetical protein